MIQANNISFAVGNKQLIKNISLNITPNSFTVIMGPNGAGKSTLLKILAGSQEASSGNVVFTGKSLSAYKPNELAQLRAVLSQHYHLNFPLEVKEIVMMGRYPYFDMQPSAEDEKQVTWGMKKMQIENFAERDYNTLSGGEAQKVQMSRVFAQIGDTSLHKKVLFLDEPVSHLDIKYQHQLLMSAKELCKENVTVVAVLHDINLALNYADHIVFMRDGKIRHELKNTNLISTEVIKDVFDIECSILNGPNNNRPVIVF